MKSTLLCITFAATIGATSAIAGGPTSPEPEAEIAPAAALPVDAQWTGFYLGLGGTRADGENNWSERGGPSTASSGDLTGTLTTFSAGHDWQRGNLVFGVGISASTGDARADVTSGVMSCTGCVTTIDKLATLQGRVGFAMGKTLVYATAGAARANVAGTTAGGLIVQGQDTLTGWTAGLGVEHFIGQKVTLSAEYRQTDLGRLELPNSCSDSCYTDVNFGTMHLSLNFRF